MDQDWSLKIPQRISMKIISRYHLITDREQIIETIYGSNILSIKTHDNKIFLYASAPHDEEYLEKTKIIMIETTEPEQLHRLTYLDTILIDGKTYHVFHDHEYAIRHD